MSRTRALQKPAWVLLVLSPMLGELLSGSEPPSGFFLPHVFLLLVLLYGVGAVLCRELTFRWGKGWPTLLALGAAYGIVEEGLVVFSFFNPNHEDLGVLQGYDRWLGVSWVWSLDLTVFHAVVSIACAVLLVTVLFPEYREKAWVSDRAFKVLTVVFAVYCVVLFVLFCLMTSWRPPFVAHATAFAAAWGLMRYAKTLPKSLAPRGNTMLGARHPFWFGFVGFWSCLAFFVHLFVPAEIGLPPLVAFVAMPLMLWALVWLVRWMARGGMGDRHRLALVSGVLSLMALVAFIQEADNANRPDNTAGMALVGLAMLVFLAWLTWRTRRNDRHTATTAVRPAQWPG
ncbi:MAG: hypothetical protein GWP08_12665 [Nitrospiraceae bacterium]|nr:hypothetical protein [Nitrospiraceae bacterium]